MRCNELDEAARNLRCSAMSLADEALRADDLSQCCRIVCIGRFLRQGNCRRGSAGTDDLLADTTRGIAGSCRSEPLKDDTYAFEVEMSILEDQHHGLTWTLQCIEYDAKVIGQFT